MDPVAVLFLSTAMQRSMMLLVLGLVVVSCNSVFRPLQCQSNHLQPVNLVIFLEVNLVICKESSKCKILPPCKYIYIYMEIIATCLQMDTASSGYVFCCVFVKNQNAELTVSCKIQVQGMVSIDKCVWSKIRKLSLPFTNHKNNYEAK